MEETNFHIKSSCTFLWKIENFNYLWLKRQEKIDSPVFAVNELENTRWNMRLYPRGNSFTNHIGFFLYRNEDNSCANIIDIYYELAFLSENGSTLCSKQSKRCTFNKCTLAGFDFFLHLESLYDHWKSTYLPLNTLTARCKIWRSDGKAAVNKYFLARSHVVVQQRSFQWQIEHFSKIGDKERKNLVITSVTNEKLIAFDLYLTVGNFGKEIIDIGIHIFDPKAKYLFFKTSILDKSGKFLINSGTKDFLFDGCEKKGTLTLLISKNQLTNGGKYFNNDALTLYCECIYSTGIISKTIETINCEITSHHTATPVVQNVGEISSDVINMSGLPTDNAVSLREDIGSLCNCEILSDIKVQTIANTIPAHTQILAARSPVFRVMFASNMKENIEGCIYISDLDDDTVRRMLLYIYTDKLEDLQWENASQLYAAANKYKIESLKSKCSAILQTKLSQKNACQILTLADMYQDKLLKKTVQDYITVQRKTLFNSEEWKHLMEINLPLAAETMHQNWIKD